MHIDTAGFGALAFAHAGKKVWYAIPKDQITQLDKLIQEYVDALVDSQVFLIAFIRIDPSDKCPGRVYHQRMFLDPQLLIERGITVYKARVIVEL